MISLKCLTRYTAAATAASVLALTAIPASAAVTMVSSSARGVYVDLSIGTIVGATIGPIAAVSGTAPAPYDLNATVLSLDQSLDLGTGITGLLSQTLSTGVITSDAESPFPVDDSGRGYSNIEDLSLGLATQLLFLPPVNVLALGLSSITSETVFNGTSLVGNSELLGLTLTALILPIDIDGSLFVNPDPNTVLIDLLGLRVVLNEQIYTSNTVGITTTESLVTTALRITYSDFLIGGRLLNGDIYLAQSEASFTSVVPEPATWGMLIAGFGIVGMAARRRRTAIAQA